MKSLYRKQRALDRTIEERFGLTPREHFKDVLVALYVELGEMMDTPPATAMSIEEYADGLHFCLSLGHRLGFEDIDVSLNGLLEQLFVQQDTNPNALLRHTLVCASRLGNAVPDFKFWKATRKEKPKGELYDLWVELCKAYGALGISLGWMPSQIRAAYYGKHEVNHTRVQEGY